MERVLIGAELLDDWALRRLGDDELWAVGRLVRAEEERRASMPHVKGAGWPEGDGRYNPNTAVKVTRT